MKKGIKHLVQCHCILPQFRNHANPVFHKFVVFSILDNDNVIEKLVQCPNCGVIHKVIDVCKSEVFIGKDENKTLPLIRDIKMMLPENVAELLESYSCDLPIWEHCAFILEESLWGEKVKFISDTSDNDVSSKFLLFKSPGSYSVLTETSDNFIGAI